MLRFVLITRPGQREWDINQLHVKGDAITASFTLLEGTYLLRGLTEMKPEELGLHLRLTKGILNAMKTWMW